MDAGTSDVSASFSLFVLLCIFLLITQTYCQVESLVVRPANVINQKSLESLHTSNLLLSSSALIFTPAHNQTVLCPVPPCGPSTTMKACCCRGPTRSGRSGRGGRAAAARGGRRSKGPIPARAAPSWAAAPSGPWGTRAEQERRHRSPRPSSLSRSCWKRGGIVLKVVLLCVSCFAVRKLGGMQAHLCYGEERSHSGV